MLSFRSRFISAALVAAGALVAFGQTAHAQTSLTPGNTITPAPTVAFISAGTQVGTTQVATFDFTNNQAGSNAFGNRIAGTIYSAAFYATGSSGAIDFYYQVQLNAATNTALSQASVGEFGAFTTAVGQTTADIDGAGPFASGTVASTSTARSADGSGLFFNFANFNASTNSYTQVVRTNATNTVNGSGSVQGTGVSGTATGNVLVTGSVAGPEPGSLILMGTGLMGATGIVVRRRRNAKK